MKRFLILFLFPLTVSCQTTDPVIKAKITAVENSLTPSIIYGDTVPQLNIGKRMSETGIKGLSIAVIKNYKIE